MVKVDKNIPFPGLPHGNGRSAKFPWKTMAVGHSFLYPKTKSKTTPYNSARQASIRYKKEFRGRLTSEGVRIWRLK